ncbi:hypothetical protein CI109_101771 [Kwoniella shandongensis]|uniref:Uncharacterized protein n=1 Tax=Kwoniella shandongensis TaxID=1734106 RepID=A0A5M6C587_9TREE|nr:uncharacterized protein CI109_001107 [Kwoniella shandongensis]KAA5530306.1 hypothetical protein CI109_001107 [Kwoniella shandongensis]
MPPAKSHDVPPPSHWPNEVIYLVKPRLSPWFPPCIIPLITTTTTKTFAPRPVKHPAHVMIKRITQGSHPANGQSGLFASKKIRDDELIIPYLGILHVTYTSVDADEILEDEHSSSDYDLSLLRLSASDLRNPFGTCAPLSTEKARHISIGVDAAKMGNAARFVNDYRGINTIGPNAEFRVGNGEGGEARMEIWSLKGKGGIGKGDEILVSYGKGWWGARKG